MNKFDCGPLDHAGFLAIKDSLTAALAAVITAELTSMGEDAKGVSWFSSCASDYVGNQVARAA